MTWQVICTNLNRKVLVKMDIMQSSLEKHYEWKGKIEIISRCEVSNRDQLSHAYTPGVAQPCLEIEKNPDFFEIYKNNMNVILHLSCVVYNYLFSF